MNRSNIIKLVLAVLLVGVVIAATFAYGSSQRKKQAENSPQNNLPTIESQSSSNQSNSQNNSDGNIPQPSSGSAQPVKPQLSQAQTPATGPADNLVASVVLGLLSGLFIISRRLYKS